MPYRQHRKKPTPSVSIVKKVTDFGLGCAVLLGFGIFVAGDLVSSVTAMVQGCDIKGNVSYNNGEKIFHVVGQEDYDATKISFANGERWFCSEAEARAAGWRKAGN